MSEPRATLVKPGHWHVPPPGGAPPPSEPTSTASAPSTYEARQCRKAAKRAARDAERAEAIADAVMSRFMSTLTFDACVIIIISLICAFFGL